MAAPPEGSETGGRLGPLEPGAKALPSLLGVEGGGTEGGGAGGDGGAACLDGGGVGAGGAGDCLHGAGPSIGSVGGGHDC
jgi:hypothetical protein